ncbi:farnesyltranstransferase [Fructilactobacillus lindneri]|uniref:Farnesyl diphosphate synthase n=2 Tax=Fructilactobacillus lindneri TaxID=53444 RepID=A0A0R2JPI3_9LACO|nr:farnesyl diphosphate synthase [Fructilactobacillus lindneri]ANZ59550.1 farnesyltranstransferase [Fructilactobacillus lindneri]KRN79054.1 geranyltranstransferase [Fructilactobacillus lindneri DSM 20690 = JCM 11027]POG98666.1 farnesyltranstransferase [Fructilactobacillus lindneri]POH04054.1 farnesyltranstransferase [Fructilactobacillus lindneri]POH04704.1 farnesyltranstransferase [Fructilactobacillus lindneri]
MENNKLILKKFKNQYTPKIDEVLKNNIQHPTAAKILEQSMNYSLLAGGKRLRPLLTLATLQAFSFPIDESIIKLSSAVELVHTYSLIHDDLPAMDNSDYRRGRLSNHKKFGTDIAILAGDGLLTLAFQWIAESNINSEKRIKLIDLLSKSAGPNGMVAGQVIDVSSDNLQLDLNQLMNLDQKKTGELFHYCIMAGAIIADVNQEDQQILSKFACNFGLAFQIYDDILDHPSTEIDEDANKNTYVNLLGMKGAQQKLRITIEDGKNALNELNDCQFVDLLASFFSYFEI